MRIRKRRNSPTVHRRPGYTRHDRRHRRRRRRRNAVKGMVMGAMMFGVGAKQKPPEKHSDQPLTANVRVSMDSFVVIPPYLAYDDIIDEAATKHGLDPDLIHAVIQTESEFNPLAVSPVGAQGLMQLMPEVQAELGVTDPFDPHENIMAGSEYLKRLLARHNGDIALTLASYNAGPGNVSKFKGVPPFKETRAYVKKIKALLAESAGD